MISLGRNGNALHKCDGLIVCSQSILKNLIPHLAMLEGTIFLDVLGNKDGVTLFIKGLMGSELSLCSALFLHENTVKKKKGPHDSLETLFWTS